MFSGAMKFLIREIRKKRGLTIEELAEMAGLSRSYLNELELGAKVINASRLQQVAASLGVQPEDLIARSVRPIAVPGRAGAGAEVYMVDDHAKGDGLYMVECPPQLSAADIVAVEVVGDSMDPIYAEGDLLFYSRQVVGVPTESIGQKCICEDQDGRVWVKQVRNGTEPGLFHLISLNPTAENKHNARLRWAARVRLHLPREFVHKL